MGRRTQNPWHMLGQKRPKWVRRGKGKMSFREAWCDGELGMLQCGWVLLI